MNPVAVSTYWDLFKHKEGYTRETLLEAINVPGVPNSCAAWNGHEFEVTGFALESRNDDNWFFSLLDRSTSDILSFTPYETSMILVFPIDPRTTAKDWKGATQGYHNETNDGWLPSHCDNDFHHDHELSLTDAIISVFQPELDGLQRDVNNKLATLIRNSGDSSAGSRELAARVKLEHLVQVREHMVECALKDTRSKHVGYYHQNPKDSHLRDEIIDCLENGITAKRTEHPVVYASVSAELTRILTRLKDKHKYETRWAKVARIKAEAAAAAAAANEEQDV